MLTLAIELPPTHPVQRHHDGCSRQNESTVTAVSTSSVLTMNYFGT